MKKVYLPVPYPGECLYSVFCRYHVRSGNTPAQTAVELAAYSGASFVGSVLSPKILFSPASQYFEVRGMRTTDLVMGSTAFQYFSLTFLTDHYKLMKGILDTRPQGQFRGPRLLSQTLSSQKKGKKLCFCPACAQEEHHIYGEPFWHTLHQIHGVKYCQIHKIPLVESVVDAKYKKGGQFYPAYIFTKESSPCCDSSDMNYKNELISIAEDINWLLGNGWRLGGLIKIRDKYILNISENHKKKGSLPQRLLEELCLPYTKWRIIDDYPYSFFRFTPLQHALYMRGHFGGAMEFFKKHY